MNNHKVVVAIDFGTSRSGYSFAYYSVADNIFPSIWASATDQAKTLTAILLNRSDLSTISFGTEAKEMHISNPDNTNTLYFEKFKMVLHNSEGVSRDRLRADNCDHTILVKTLITKCIGCIKRAALARLEEVSTLTVPQEAIKWVLTVPAIWNHAARLVMMEAARDAGIPESSLSIVLEPEVASVHCMSSMAHAHLEQQMFMLVDAGGGTVDVTVHKIDNGKLKEVVPPSGDAWGSGKVDEEYGTFLERLFGTELRKGSEDWLMVMNNFEAAKMSYKGPNHAGNYVILQVIPGMVDSEVLAEYDDGETKATMNRGLLRMPYRTFARFFSTSIPHILAHITTKLNQPELRDVKHIFVVGGFSNNIYLQRYLREGIPEQVKVKYAPKPLEAVMIGAVVQEVKGDKVPIIVSRVAPRTVGIEVYDVWNEELHQGREKLIGDNGSEYCPGAVDIFFKAGDNVPVGMQVRKRFNPLRSKDRQIGIKFFSSTKREVMFADEEGVRRLGTIAMELPLDNNAENRLVEVTINVGGTVFSAKAVSVEYSKGFTTTTYFPMY